MARVDEVMGLMSRIAAGVGHAHTSGVIHRDLKPSNILIDAKGQPRILDFGLARAEDGGAEVTATREFVGTPAFAAPEQFAGMGALPDARTDVYALGVIMYVVLTGRHPYPTDGSVATLARHVMSTEPAAPSRYVQRLPMDVETIVLKCLSKEVSRRYSNASALASDIEDYLTGRPISARRDSAVYVLRKIAVRHRVLAAAVLLVFVTITASLIGLAFIARNLDRERRVAQSALSDSNVGRARLMAKVGDVERAESILWDEALGAGVRCDDSLCFSGSPQVVRSAWSLIELYARVPRLFRVRSHVDIAGVGIDPGRRTVWAAEVTGSRRTWTLDGTLLGKTQEVFARNAPIRGFTEDNGRYMAVQSGDAVVIHDLVQGTLAAGPVPWPNDILLGDVSDDGAFLVCAGKGKDGPVQLFNAQTLALIDQFHDHAFSARFQRRPEGLLLLLGTFGGPGARVIVRQAPQWKIVRSLAIPEWGAGRSNAGIRNVRLTPDGSRMLATFQENIVLFELTAEDARVVAMGVSLAPINCANFDELGKTVATASSDGTVSVRRVPDLAPLTTIQNATAITWMSIRADPALTVVSDHYKRVSAYESSDRPWLERVHASGGTKQSLAIALDGTIAWGNDEGTLVIRPVHGPERTVHAHNDPITTVVFSPDGSEILTSGEDGAIHVWRRDGSLAKTIATGLPRVWSVRYSPDGYMIACGTQDGFVLLWKDGESEPSLKLDCNADRVPMIAFSPDGRRIATAVHGGAKGLSYVWDTHTGVKIHDLAAPQAITRAITFSPDGDTIATGRDDRTVRVFDARSGKQLRVIDGLPWAIFDLKFHPGGNILFAVGRGGEVIVIDTTAGAELAKLIVHEKLVFSIAISPDGKKLYTSGQDPWIGIIDLDRLRSYIRGNEAYWVETLGRNGRRGSH